MTDITYTVNQIRDIVLPIAKKNSISKVYIFGSYARGDADASSDIDLRIDAENLSGILGFNSLYSDLENALDKPLDIVTIQSLRDHLDEPLTRRFVKNIKKYECLL
ncbi:MAG: nucleotidyltransferase domain-containing protein [Clostridia bacterium]|nr:nucleotidyltransferase domain-containing protein [Clostridia bacterium]